VSWERRGFVPVHGEGSPLGNEKELVPRGVKFHGIAECPPVVKSSRFPRGSGETKGSCRQAIRKLSAGEGRWITASRFERSPENISGEDSLDQKKNLLLEGKEKRIITPKKEVSRGMLPGNTPPIWKRISEKKP